MLSFAIKIFVSAISSIVTLGLFLFQPSTCAGQGNFL